MDEAAVQSLRSRFAVHHQPDLVDDRAALLASLAEAEALIVRNRTQVDAALLERAPRLRVVGRLGVGLDNIDLAACDARAVAVFPATGANAVAVAEYVICSAMMLLRGFWQATPAVAAGEWPRTALSSGREVSGRTLGLVGFGGIGQLVAVRSQALGMRVVACDPALAPDLPLWRERGVQPLALEQVLAAADVLSLHVPLTPQTRNLIDARRIAAMKPQAVLINTSRGGIVDEAALAAALRAGSLGGAAVDVFEQEPLPKDSPVVDAPNLLLTPHIAGLTFESNQRVSSMVADRVARFLCVG
ncbi:MAG: hydroxyacid dehydrogenase [Lautropia sp.]|nr:hydroxyacid dehydrogenase [Lautropia sp.]